MAIRGTYDLVGGDAYSCGHHCPQDHELHMFVIYDENFQPFDPFLEYILF